MKTRYLVFLFAMLGCAVNAQNFNFTSNIHTKEYDGLTIYLLKNDVVDKQKSEKIDSCVIKEGQYHFSVAAPDSACWGMVALPPKDKNFVYGLPELSIPIEQGNIVADCHGYTQTLRGGTITQQYDDMVLSHERELRKQVDQMVVQRQEIENLKSATYRV